MRFHKKDRNCIWRNEFLIFLTGLCIFYFITINCFAQKINTSFSEAAFIDGFNMDQGNWSIMVDAENLFVIQNDHYVLNRKNSVSPYTLFSKAKEEFSDFQIRAAVQFTNDNENSSIGLIFMAQPHGVGGFIFEINKKKQYRISQIVSNNIHLLSGEESTGGWVKTQALKSKNEYDVLEVRAFNKEYDVYINSQYIASFTEITYKKGKTGLVIGPSTQAQVDYFHIYTTQIPLQVTAPIDSSMIFAEIMDTIKNSEKKTDSLISSVKVSNTKSIKNDSKQTFVNAEKTIEEDNTDEVLALTEAIVKFKTQINKLQEEKENLTNQLEEKESYKKALALLENQLIESNKINDSLRNSNNTLQKFKEVFEDSENKDIVIVLSKSLKKEKLKNESLIMENINLKTEYHQLRDSVETLLFKNNEFIKILEENNIQLPSEKVEDNTPSLPSEKNSLLDKLPENPINNPEENSNIIINAIPTPEDVKVQKAKKRVE